MAKHGIFNQPIAPKQRTTSKGFVAPTKEQATTGRYMTAGDYYGTGFKAPIGKMRGDSTGMNPVPQKKLKVDPNSLA